MTIYFPRHWLLLSLVTVLGFIDDLLVLCQLTCIGIKLRNFSGNLVTQHEKLLRHFRLSPFFRSSYNSRNCLKFTVRSRGVNNYFSLPFITTTHLKSMLSNSSFYSGGFIFMCLRRYVWFLQIETIFHVYARVIENQKHAFSLRSYFYVLESYIT